MIIILFFIIASVIFSTLVVSACMLSSRISQQEGFVEVYEEVEEPMPAVQPYTAH